jgi:glycosyltransferase involved in cell wall biosynthesis
MKKILILTPIIPYPLSEGGIVAQYAFADYLRKKVKLIFLFILKKQEHIESVEELRKRWPEVDIYTINSIPKKIKKPLIKRIFNKLISFLYKVSNFFTYKDTLLKSRNIAYEDLESCVNFVHPLNKDYIEKIREISKQEKLDLIQVEHFAFMNLIYALKEDIPTVFIHHELQFARLKTSSKIIKSEIYNDYSKYIYSLTENIERIMLDKYSAILTFSDIDRKKLKNILLKDNIYSSPFPILDNAFQNLSKEDFTVEKLIFVGSDIHTPNFDGLKWFIEEIFEEIYLGTHLRLEVIGKWSKENQKLFDSYKNIKFLGFVEDLQKHSRNSVQVVPIRIGSGIRTKILYSMAQFTPVITTEIGIEGINAKDNEEVMIAKNKKDFIDKIKYLIYHKDEAYRIAKNAQNFVKTNYTQEVLGKRRLEVYQNLIDNKI